MTGYNFGISLAVFLLFVELVGGICIALGLFTRFFAAAKAIEMGVLTFHTYWAHGFSGHGAATNTCCCGA